MTISDLKKGDSFCIGKVILNKEIGKRLADMGFIQGTSGVVVRTALLGDPIQVCIKNYNISIRRAEAAGIEILDPGMINNREDAKQ